MTNVDAAKLPVMLNTLRLPTIGRLWQEFGARADREGWGSARFLAALCEHELADRATRRIARHMAESGLPHGKTFATFDFAAVPTIRRAHVMALAAGDTWLEQSGNLLIFGGSGTGKTHLAVGWGLAACRAGLRVRFFTAAGLVSQLEKEQKQYTLDRFLRQVDRAHLLICDELGYVTMSRGGVELLFRVFADRYERGSILVTSNLPFSEWGQVFQGERMTAALLDRLCHHCHIFEMNGESYRFRESMKTKKGRKAE